MFRRVCGIILLLMLFSQTAYAKGTVLTPLLNKTVRPDIPDKISVEYLEIFDGVGETQNKVFVVTSSRPSGGKVMAKNRIYSFTSDGRLDWSYGIDGWIRKSIGYDLDRDGVKELLVSTGQMYQGIQRGKLYLFDHRGDLVRTTNANAILQILHVTDLDKDKYYEIAAGSTRKIILYTLL